MIDRQRATRLLESVDLDALVLCEPEACRYATGVTPGPADLFRRAGSTFVVIPRLGDQPVGAVVTDFDARRYTSAVLNLRTHPAWIETVRLGRLPSAEVLGEQIEHAVQAIDRPADFTRPATFDLALAVDALKSLLAEYGLRQGRLGFDLNFVPAFDRDRIANLLPEFTIVNGSPILDEYERIRKRFHEVFPRDRDKKAVDDYLRAIKNEDEIRRLQVGIELSESGFERLMAEGRVGMNQRELAELWRAGVHKAAEKLDNSVSTAEFMTLGASPRSPDTPAERGDPLKADMISDVDGYQADMSRNFVFGEPSEDQAKLHEIAEQAFEAGLERLRPGNKLADVHRAASEGLAAAGLRSYRRGHFGHGVGLSVFSEQWPFISADSDVEIEAGMVLAYEIPLYVEGLASFNLEDQFLISADGPVSMNKLPRKLGTIG